MRTPSTTVRLFLAGVALAALAQIGPPAGPAVAAADEPDCFAVTASFEAAWDWETGTWNEIDLFSTFQMSGAYADGGAAAHHDRVDDPDGTWSETLTLTGANGALVVSVTIDPEPYTNPWGYPYYRGAWATVAGTGDYAGLEDGGSATYIAIVGTMGVGYGVPVLFTTYALDSCPEVNKPPTVVLSTYPWGGEAPLEVILTATAADPDGSVVGYEWDVDGDGVYDYDTGATNELVFTYETAGVYTAVVRATDDDGATATAQRTIGVTAPPPPPPPPPPEPVLLAEDGFESGTLSGGAGWSAAWNASGDVSVVSGDGPYAGTRHLAIGNGTSRVERGAALAGTSEVGLSVAIRVEGFRKKDEAWLKISPDGSAWTTLRALGSAQSDGRYHVYAFDLQGLTPTDGFRIALEVQAGGRRAAVHLDEVRLTGIR